MEILYVDDPGRDLELVGKRAQQFDVGHLAVGEFQDELIAVQRFHRAHEAVEPPVREGPPRIVAETDMHADLAGESFGGAVGPTVEFKNVRYHALEILYR